MTSDPSAPDWVMANMIRAHARSRGDAIACIFEDKSYSYTDLDDHSNQVANAFIAAGTQTNSRIAILDFNSYRFAQTLYGALKARATIVTVNARLAAPEVNFIINDSGAEILLVGREHYELVESIEQELASIKHIFALHGEHPRWPAFDDVTAAQSSRDPALAARPSDDTMQLYTSGTTGHPKGVCHTNAHYAATLQSCRGTGWGDYADTAVALVCMPMFHVAGYNIFNLAIAGGATAMIMKLPDPAQILDAIPRHGITDTLLVPAVIDSLISHRAAASTDFTSLQTVVYGAAPMAEDILARATGRLGCGFVHVYGLTESLGLGTYLPPDMHHGKLGKLRSVGKPYPGIELRVVNTQGLDCEADEVGEIILKCASVMRCYWQRPDATAQTVRDGWLYTGDAGYLDTDGYVFLHDRIKDMIICGGENVYPAEVENVLFGHPCVADVAVIGVPDQRWGEAVKAIIVLAAGTTLDEQQLTKYVRQHIAGFKTPKSFAVVDELPRNASGKVLRRRLREQF